MGTQKRRIGIIGGIALLILLSVFYFSFTHIGRSGKNAVHIDIFPRSALVTIDGQEVDRGTVYLETGSYSITAFEEGFKEFSDTLIVEPHKKTYVMTLAPISEEAKKLFDRNQREYAQVRQLSEQAVRESGEYFHKQNPIASQLPYRTFIFTIGYRMDISDPSGNSIIIEIDAGESHKQAALQRIRQMGYDPTDFTINFRDYENPFSL